MNDTDNTADTLDIRDLIERIEELRGERGDLAELQSDYEEAESALNRCDSEEEAETLRDDLDEAAAAVRACEKWTEENTDEAEELAALESFLEEMKGYGGDHQWEGDWYPVTLIRDSYWEDYARDYAEEVGGKEMAEAHWPFNCIDWEKAARELQMDYSSAEFNGVTYWYR